MLTKRWCCTLFVASLLTVAAVAQPTQPDPAGPQFIGEVTAADVYVRSGPSTNYYEVTKLAAGDRVEVYTTDNEWYVIAPPKGCFSLIHKNFVDLDASEKEGVVNGDAVRVRAGSELKPDLYAKQLKLNRGATVQVIQPHNDDYLRIVPPPAARLYVHGRYVQRVPESRLAEEAVGAAASFTGAQDPEGAQQTASGTTKEPAEGQERPPLEPGKFRDRINELDAKVDAELQKPLPQRDFKPLIERFAELVGQEADPYAKAYAKARIVQLQQASESVAAVRHLRILGDQITTDRKNALMQRSRIRPPARRIGGGFDAVGELRTSFLFDSAVGPRWYRLVADGASPLRTVGYVEIPEDSGIDVARLLGRKVGVRARERRLLTGDVDPVELFVASELVVLDVTENTDGEQESAPGQGGGG